MVAAAFIGPGTVTTASLAGARYGTALLWTIVFSIIATVVLQEMSARLGVVSRLGLGEALRRRIAHPVLRHGAALLVISAIGIGAAAYESGNILGGATGLEILTGLPVRISGPLMGLVAGVLLLVGRYRMLERLFVALVAAMAICFVLSAALAGPGAGEIARGFVPTVPDGSLWLVTALIGTTVVGYNLFLHAASARQRWSGPAGLAECRADVAWNVGIGGVVTISILLTAAAVFPPGTEIDNVGTMVAQIEPVAGPQAPILFSLGLFMAGMTSAITAPLAAAYATSGVLGWRAELAEPKFRIVWLTVLIAGIAGSALGYRPVEAIVFAQVANGILLPVVAAFLLWIVNDESLLGEHRNGRWRNLAGGLVILVVVVLAARTLTQVMIG
jgi:Mn2+/Fe2+ NRAMP family transporter